MGFFRGKSMRFTRQGDPLSTILSIDKIIKKQNLELIV
jgi:hypothetical protein